MDPGTLILKKTVPADQDKTRAAIESLIGNDKAAKNSFKQKPLQFLPFQTFEDVPEDNDDGEEQKFLRCSYNNVEKGAYRSPYTHKIYVFKKNKKGEEEFDVYEKSALEDEKDISAIEKAANEVWSGYTQLYYGNEGVGSAFLKARGKKGTFEGIFGIHKHTPSAGSWDSVHMVQVDETKDSSCTYRVDSAVLVSIHPHKEAAISCSLTKETVKTCKVRISSLANSHLENLGEIMEDVELEFRSRMERVDIPKSIEVIDSAYKKSAKVTVEGVEEGEEPSYATGMGVGHVMIGEIANKAREKQAAGNPFLDAMKARQKEKEAEFKDSDKTGDEYVDKKKTLKKSTNAGDAAPAAKQKAMVTGTSSEFSDAKAGLKRSSAQPKQLIAPASPTPAFSDAKAGLKKSLVQQKQPIPPASPTPEFMDFRNKLKKSNKD